MRALVFNKQVTYSQDYPRPEPKEGEALIRVDFAGICNTDLEIVRGYMDFQGIPGHEFVGVVEKCSEEVWVGRRVVGEINIGCRICVYCQKNMANHCPSRSVLGILRKDGAFAEYITLPVKNLHLIPDGISDQEAVFVEPLAAAFQILQQVEIKKSDRVCVLGDGKLGLLVGQVISLTGCDPMVWGKHPEKLRILENRGIKTQLITDNPSTNYDVVIDCTGSDAGLNLAMKMVRPTGKIILKTTVAGKRFLDLNHLVINEIGLIGSRCGPFPPAIKALQERQVSVHPFIEKIFSLEEGLRAFEYASRRGALKVILKIR